MEEETNKQEKSCPLCEVADGTIESLRQNKETSEEKDLQQKKKKFWIFGFVIFIVAFGSIVLYYPVSKFLEKRTQVETQSTGFTLVEGYSPVGETTPDFIAKDAFGVETSLSSFLEKSPVLLVFCTTQCTFCIQEMADLNSFSQDNEAKIKVIVLTSQETADAVKRYVKEKKLDLLMLIDESGEIWQKYLVQGTPVHFLISKQGQIVAAKSGLTSRSGLEVALSLLNN
ncbi:MAG: TlpA disulfide reductase family protein [Candidatus Nealsonbacteria bacterium]